MRRKSTAHGLPDVSVISEAIRLAEDVAAAERAHPAPSPAARGGDDLRPRPMTPPYARLRDFLAALPAGRLAEVMATYWLGHDPAYLVATYGRLLRHARGDFDNTVPYLTAQPLDAGLRRGLELLGLETVRDAAALTPLPEVIP